MLKLKNVRRTNEYIEADYTPEDSMEKGHIKIDLKTEDFLEKVLTTLDKPFATYATMARTGLLRHKDDKNLPNEYLVMWY